MHLRVGTTAALITYHAAIPNVQHRHGCSELTDPRGVRLREGGGAGHAQVWHGSYLGLRRRLH